MFTKIYHLLRSYLFNGVYAYALFGMYALTISPYIIEFIDYGKENSALGILGFAVYIAESFAFNFKLKSIRIRGALRRKAYFEQYGVDIIPRPGILVFVCLIFRVALRLVILMVSATALGIPCTESKMSSQGILIICSGVFIDVAAFVYMYVRTGIFRPFVDNERDFIEQEEGNKKWEEENVPLYSTPRFTLLEFISDFVLQVYALMLFTSIWYYMNKQCYEVVQNSFRFDVEDLHSAFDLAPMLLAITVVWVMPIRIAYWLEDSMMAFKWQEKLGMWLIFTVAAISAFVPTLVDVQTMYFANGKELPTLFTPEYIHYMLAGLLIFAVVTTKLLVTKHS